jgi:hypothetical protein
MKQNEYSHSQVNISEVLDTAGYNGFYLPPRMLFGYFFNHIPNLEVVDEIDCEKAALEIQEKFKDQITRTLHKKRRFGSEKMTRIDDLYIVFDFSLLLVFDHAQSGVGVYYSDANANQVESVKKMLNDFKIQVNEFEGKVSIISSNQYGFDVKPYTIRIPDMDLNAHYNDDMVIFNQHVLKAFESDIKKGIVILNGKPGTGKTSYIRYLLGKVDKEVIFIPPDLIPNLTAPNMIKTLLDHPDSILVIEDAEKAVVTREYDSNSPVSSLLNISDGLLGDCLRAQIICTFNTDLSKVDKALMRKGRLIGQYEFDSLSPEKATRLSQKIGHEISYNEKTSLAEVYNPSKTVKPAISSKFIGFQFVS